MSQASVGSTDEIRTKTRKRKERQPINLKKNIEENTNFQSKRKFFNSNSSEDKTPKKAPRVIDDSVVEVKDIEMDVIELEDGKPKVDDVIVVSEDDEVSITKLKDDFKHNKKIVSQAIFQDNDDQFDDLQDDFDILMIPPQEIVNTTKPKIELEQMKSDAKSNTESLERLSEPCSNDKNHSEEIGNKGPNQSRKDLEQESSNEKNLPKKLELSVVNVSSSDLLKTNLDEIVSEG